MWSEAIGSVKLDCALHVLKSTHNLVSVAPLCDKRHPPSLTKSKCVVKMQRNIVGVGRPTDGIYAVDFKKYGELQTLLCQRNP